MSHQVSAKPVWLYSGEKKLQNFRHVSEGYLITRSGHGNCAFCFNPTGIVWCFLGYSLTHQNKSIYLVYPSMYAHSLGYTKYYLCNPLHVTHYNALIIRNALIFRIWDRFEPSLKCSLLNAGPAYLRNPDFVITVPADGLAPEGARSSAGTVVITKLHDNIT